MRTYDAIEAISKKITEDNLCEAIILKGSIGRGDDDEYSDVDMYLVVVPEKMNAVLAKRQEYLSAYKEIVYLEDVNFGLPQKVAIYEDALHVDLYIVQKEQIGDADPIKVWYDPKGLYEDYTYHRSDVSEEDVAEYFKEVLYSFVEADTAYKRKNYAWAAKIMGNAIAMTAFLLRYHYDKKYAFLGLKKINEIIPAEQYQLLEDAYGYLGRDTFDKANGCLIRALEVFIANSGNSLKGKLDMPLFGWVKGKLGSLLFANGILNHSANVTVRIMNFDDIPSICKADKDESESNKAYLRNQLSNQEKQACTALLALYDGEVAGYVFLYYKCKWGGLANIGLPGVVDLIVFEKYRNKGVATALMDAAEEIARKYSNKVYLDVCLNHEYGTAQRLYVKRGYVPDGQGAYYEEKVCEVDADIKNDDELTLCLVKEL